MSFEIFNIKYWSKFLIKDIHQHFGYYPSIDELIKCYNNENTLPELSLQQKLSLKYHNDLSKKIPRDDVKKYVDEFMNDLKYNKKYYIVGSYCRGKKMCGDIDLIIQTNQKTWCYNARKLSSIILDAFVISDKKAHFICKSKIDNKIFQLDIFLSSVEAMPFMILDKSSGVDFITDIRKLCLTLYNIHLSNVGFKDQHNNLLTDINKKIKNEQDIFKFLKFEYIKPEER